MNRLGSGIRTEKATRSSAISVIAFLPLLYRVQTRNKVLGRVVSRILALRLPLCKGSRGAALI